MLVTTFPSFGRSSRLLDTRVSSSRTKISFPNTFVIFSFRSPTALSHATVRDYRLDTWSLRSSGALAERRSRGIHYATRRFFLRSSVSAEIYSVALTRFCRKRARARIQHEPIQMKRQCETISTRVDNTRVYFLEKYKIVLSIA